MLTSKLDRLNKLFEGDKRIAQIDQGKPHIADVDINPKSSTIKPAVSYTAAAEQSDKVPRLALDAGKTTPPSSPLGRDLDLLPGSDEDEYLASFSREAIVEKPPLEFRPDRKPRRGGHQGRRRARNHLTASARRLSDQDVDGNPLTGHFCPLSLVAKFPYKYMVDTNDRVSKHFFAQNKFYQREWEIYYIAPPESIVAKPILLLPLGQVKHLIQQINMVFKTDIDCPPDPFTVSFFDDGTPQPKRLGISRSRDDLADMEASISALPYHFGECLEDLPKDDAGGLSSSRLRSSSANLGRTLREIVREPTERSSSDFKAKIERIIMSTKKNKQAAKQKKMEERSLQQQDWVKQLQRAQRYFGLRPEDVQLPALNTASSWSEQPARYATDLRESGTLLDALDTSKPAPYAFECDPVIVCVDIEAYERDHRRITEVGVSTLDTLDLAGIAPGNGAENWIAHIRSRHFRIRGREHLENKDFCPGNANNFQFGTSEWVSLDAAAEAVDQCFEYPFSAQFKAQQAMSINRTHSPVFFGHQQAQKGPKKRNIIFLGHDIRNEFDYLRTLGTRVSGLSVMTYPTAATQTKGYGTGRNEPFATIIEALDTGVLYRVLVKNTQNQGLGKMMVGLGRTAWHLHNAGNDARYTLEALVALLIKARVLEDRTTLKERTDSVNENWGNAETASLKYKTNRTVNEKADAAEWEVRGEFKGLDKALHTMKIADNSGEPIEVEDPWLMAQESDHELPLPLVGEEGENGQWIEEVDGTKTILYRDPAATGGQYQVIGSTNALDES